MASKIKLLAALLLVLVLLLAVNLVAAKTQGKATSGKSGSESRSSSGSGSASKDATGSRGDTANSEDEEPEVDEVESTTNAGEAAGPSGTTGTGAEGGSGGDDSEDEEYEFDDGSDSGLSESVDLIATVFFPGYFNYRFPVQTELTMLVGLHNKGDKPFNITTMGAYLHSPFDLSYYIQNFSHREVGVVVEPGQEVSVEYSVKPDKNLEPLEFWFSSFILYNDSDSKQFRTFLANRTIELIERPSDVNLRRIFSYFFVVAVSGLVGYVAYNVLVKKNKKGKKSSSSSESTRDTIGDEWLPDSFTKQKKRPLASKKK